MSHAITILNNAAEAAETNAPIRDQLGHTEQAALDRAVATDCREAIAVLTSEPLKKSPDHSIA